MEKTKDAAKATAEAPIAVNNANLVELKVACDDAVRKYMTETRNYKQSHKIIDVKLLLGYVSAIMAGGEFWYTWKKPFDQVRTLTMIVVAVYFVLSTFLAFWTTFVEKDIIFVGTKDNEKVVVRSQLKKHKPYYHLTINRKAKSKKYDKKVETATKNVGTLGLSKSFGEWFDVDGVFLPSDFAKELDFLMSP